MADHRPTILSMNVGSSSLKAAIYDARTLEQLDRVASDASANTEDDAASPHARAADAVLDQIDPGAVVAVGHRVVCGGTQFDRPTEITPEVERAIAELGAVAPLHHGAALAVIRRVRERLPGVQQIAVFDTAFHRTIPEENARYAIPEQWYSRWGIRKLGYHGLSHGYVATRTAEILGRPLAGLKLVTCHLGAGASLCAVAGGTSVQTTMGFTPLDGLPMATRSGSIDPGIVTYVIEQHHLDPKTLEAELNDASGLLGLSGLSGDMEELLAAAAEGHDGARLAIAVFVSRLVELIAQMAAAMRGVDAVVFTGGIGEHATPIRARVLERLAWLGFTLDSVANESPTGDRVITDQGSPRSALVIHTREDLVVAQGVQSYLRQRQIAQRVVS